MKRSRFSEEQIIGILREVQGGGNTRAVCAAHNISEGIARYGAPEHIRSDNGPEFIAYAIRDWLEKAAIKTIYITPGSPWEPSEARWPAEGSP